MGFRPKAHLEHRNCCYSTGTHVYGACCVFLNGVGSLFQRLYLALRRLGVVNSGTQNHLDPSAFRSFRDPPCLVARVEREMLPVYLDLPTPSLALTCSVFFSCMGSIVKS